VNKFINKLLEAKICNNLARDVRIILQKGFPKLWKVLPFLSLPTPYQPSLDPPSNLSPRIKTSFSAPRLLLKISIK